MLLSPGLALAAPLAAAGLLAAAFALLRRPAGIAAAYGAPLLGGLGLLAALVPCLGGGAPALRPGVMPLWLLVLPLLAVLTAAAVLRLGPLSARRWQRASLALLLLLALVLLQRIATAAIAVAPAAADEGWRLASDLLVTILLAAVLLLFVTVLLLLAFDRRLEAAMRREAAVQRAVRDELELRVAGRTRELELAKDRAEAANRAKSEFLSSMSHELRTPLNSIMGFAQLTLYNAKREPVTQRQSRALENIRRSGQLLLQLIDDVLDLSRIESGTIGLSLEEVEVAALLEELRATLQPLAERHAVVLTIAAPDTLPPVRADRTRLLQVLVNLVSNAVKYNRPEGRVELEVVAPSGDERRLLFRVRDTGRGIPRDRWDEVFKPFNRIGAEHSAIEGTGIGLTIVRRLVELMQGEIRFDSVVDQGSCFEVLLAAGDGSLRSDRVRPLADATHWRHPVGPFALLYIEDNPSNIELMESLVESLPGVSFLPAADPRLGLELARRLQPQVIVLDINLPHLSGYEVLQQLRSDPRTADIPVIGLSASAMPKDVERAKRAGFHDYLVKPLQVERFLALLHGLVSRVPVA